MRRLVETELERRGHVVHAGRWQECASRISLRRCRGDLHHPSWTPLRCELRICPWCARRRAAMQVDEFCRQLEVLNAAGALGRGRATNRPSFKLLTLTLRAVPRATAERRRVSPEALDDTSPAAVGDVVDDGVSQDPGDTGAADQVDVAAELRVAVGRILDAWRKLQVVVGFDRDKRDKLFGALAAVEIGPRRNVHLHVCYWGRYVPQATIAQAWRALTGDSYVVDIRELRGSWRAAAREVCKYVTKAATPANWSRSRDTDPTVPEVLLVDIFEALKGRRRVATYGLFYNVETPDPEPRVCEVCGSPFSYVGTFSPEDLSVADLRAYLERRERGRPP